MQNTKNNTMPTVSKGRKFTLNSTVSVCCLVKQHCVCVLFGETALCLCAVYLKQHVGTTMSPGYIQKYTFSPVLNQAKRVA